MSFKAYGTRVLDTRTNVWYYCRTKAQAKQLAEELNR